ncbi:MAG: aldo/keto reductase [Candidatus Aminicenantes bacterium]|nr:aldo/keto reductase [Candidatus Aminicenantes bacterium]
MKILKKDVSRRQFLKEVTTGLFDLTIIPSVSRDSQSKLKDRPFIYRTLGKTGLKLPIVSMGVMNANNPNLVSAALDAGIILLDTAWYYQNGRNEEMIGEVIKDRPRNSYVISTKIFEPRDRITDRFPANAKSDTFVAKFETSLRRLGLDYVDLLSIHNIYKPEDVLFEPYLNAMLKLKKEGKTRFIGLSTHQNEPAIIREARVSKKYDVILTAYNFRQAHRKEIEGEMELAVKEGMGFVGMKAIAGSVYNIGRKVHVNAKAALKWALQNENIHTNIAGFTTFDQMETALSVMENLKLTPEEEADLEGSKHYSSLYCQQCEVCRSQCHAGLDIPTLMRSYMYAYGYKNLQAAKEALNQGQISRIACIDCDSCNVRCAMGFDVRERALSLSKIQDVPESFLV